MLIVENTAKYKEEKRDDLEFYHAEEYGGVGFGHCWSEPAAPCQARVGAGTVSSEWPS